ncbi:hypothetical protein [Nocardia bovistercoris]|uniref:Uncharacterized protein n=1 Tax=Nocardia bovistercoris TaxID=2785916 RepID=A0A931N3B8_9NOCA|nr:hypothetical protein [Nocardia bovistercoris]MBH0780455.1 hypothetical protein [Nocardia bovistercoris]
MKRSYRWVAAHGVRESLSRVALFAAVVVTISACGAAEDARPRGSAAASEVGATTSDPGSGIAGRFTRPGQTSSTIVVRTRTVSGAAVADVPVELTLIDQCDPARQTIPTGGSAGTLGLRATTDAGGSATFLAAVGCYYYEITSSPPGRKPVTTGRQTLFLSVPGQTVDAVLTFQDR